jgi:hypothetical protein
VLRNKEKDAQKNRVLPVSGRAVHEAILQKGTRSVRPVLQIGPNIRGLEGESFNIDWYRRNDC